MRSNKKAKGSREERYNRSKNVFQACEKRRLREEKEKILKKQYDKAKIFASKALKYKNIKTLYKIRASDIINFK